MPESNPPDTAATSQSLVDEALAWLVTVKSGHAMEEDHRRCRAWLASSPAHLAAYHEAEALWRDIGQLRIAADSAGSVPPLPRQSRLRYKTWAVAASLLLAVAMFWTENSFQWVSSAMADYRSDVGEQRTVTLNDGTAVRLNTDSAVNVHLSDTRRDVHLLKGEASFTVARDPERPFAVRSGPIVTSALGTAFSIRYEGDGITVTVTEHAVRVSLFSGAPRREVAIEAGQQVHYSPTDGFTAVRRIDAGTETAWQRGKMIFERQPLFRVVEELNRYRRGHIVILNPALRTLNITGLFDVADPDAALRMIQDTLPIRHTNLPPYFVLLH
ncbi:MAG: FecR family protein [Nitrospira sp.]